MNPTLTSEQQRAVHTHDRGLVVVAGAGSGKTRVLVERYLALLEANPEWRLESLVAITFTRKATHEMRERLRQRLEQRAQAADEEEREIWLGRLAGIDSAPIDTIDALCRKILRLSAAEARIDPDFQVLDEERVEIEREQVVALELERMAAENATELALFGGYDHKQIMEALLEQLEQPVLPVPADLLERWRDSWNILAREQLELLRAAPAFVDALRWQQTHSWPGNDKLGEVWTFCRPLLNELAEEPEPERALELLRGLSEAINLRGGSVGKWGDKQALAEAKGYLRDLRGCADDTLAEIGEGISERDRRAAELLPLWQRLIARAQNAWRERKRAANQMDFADLERLAREVLQHPEVRRRFRGEFNQVLVDEFHDVSPIQWEIIRALADPAEAGKLFLVGDPRQSIYSFRGADVRVFNVARREILAAEAPGAEIALSRSFRSHQPLQDVLNGIFRKVLRRGSDGPSGEYEADFGEPLTAERQRSPAAQPALELLLLDCKAAELRADGGHLSLAWTLGRRLRALVDEGRPVWDKDGGYLRSLGYGDIALLFQTHKGMPHFEEAFRELGLPFVTEGGQGFYGRQEVVDLLNLLRALRNPGDDLALAAVLRSPLFALSDDALLALRWMRDDDGRCVPLWPALQGAQGLPADEVARAGDAAATLQELAQLAGRMSVEELLREALRRTGYLAALSGLADGERRRGNVEKLLEKAADSGATLYTEFEPQPGELSDRELRVGEASSDSDSAISLMTVHKAKGLEFPLVVLADAGNSHQTSISSVLWRDDEGELACKVFDMGQGKHQPTYSWQRATKRRQERDLAERRRLFYVAATRARDWLIICGQMKSRPGENSWLAWLQDALDIDLAAGGRMEVGGGQITWRCQSEASETDASRAPRTRVTARMEAVGADRDEGSTPALLQPLPPQPPLAPRQWAATDLAEAIYGAGKLHTPRAAPELERRADEDSDFGEGRRLGDVVHEVLRWWRPDAHAETDALERWLRHYLQAQRWHNQEALLQQGLNLLERFRGSALCGRLGAAQTVLRELPFLHRYKGCEIRGSIDLLLQDRAGRWTLVDFKTTDLGKDAGPARARENARRHHLQLGIYAAALLQHPEIAEGALDVQLHYLRHSLDVVVPPAEWRSALTDLDKFLADEAQNGPGAG